jgi:hypothetical protein
MVDRSFKISANVLARLENMTRGETISVIILIGQRADTLEERRRGGDRERLMADLKEETREAVHEIDRVLASHGGQRREVVDSLGAVPVTATAPAVVEMASIASVRSIIEDQPLRELF